MPAEEKRRAWRSGGFAATRSDPALATVTAPDLATPPQIRAARAELYRLVLSRTITAPTGHVLGSLLDAADRAVHQAAMREYERRGGRRTDPSQVVIVFPPWFEELATARRRVPAIPATVEVDGA